MSRLAADEQWMREALKLAHKAGLRGEVPVGAVLVSPDGQLLSVGSNIRETLTTPLGHAELQALHRAAKKTKSWRLTDSTLYVTLEPCLMCAGAIQQARIGRVVYGAVDPKAGAVESLYRIFEDPRLNHQVKVQSGVLAEECAALLKKFFFQRRAENKAAKKNKIFRERASAVVIHKNKLLGFKAIDPTSRQKYFFLPGGAIESDETPLLTAARECLEETGYEINIFPETAFERKYDFQWNGESYSCRTVFYLAALADPEKAPAEVNDASYHKGVEWLPLKEIDQKFAYHEDILWAVQKLTKLARKKRL